MVYNPITLSQTTVRTAYKLFKQHFAIQDLNSVSLQVSQEHETLLKELGINPKHVYEVVPCRFLNSIDPHEDYSFCKINNIKSAVAVVLNKKRPSIKHYDDLSTSYLYTESYFHELKQDNAYKFNPRKVHALMNSTRLDMLVFFLTINSDNFTKASKSL